MENKKDLQTVSATGLPADPDNSNMELEGISALRDYMKGAGAQRILTTLRACDEKTHLKYYSLLLEHFLPKLVRSEEKRDISIRVYKTPGWLKPEPEED